ncbi:MAG TPA: LapD/MoxY N-terminal periplasmic domain-containing protein [Methylibium sp.]|uniref:bifunctional diguanylate cyclase/phosphodiesterase n=1 Tax=Methylibium sp. TaxID=2067992 RepID=UPI002DBA0B6A|nr:LapD/MoxY N-terminal periplasmic domain-containing protein [Methylibium sp.]HEU4460105.1 LapD/MoxY N-terminal periplasmic domain-containing protein [Methylibium sp.]
MSLIRQLWLLLVATVVLGAVGSTAVSVSAARHHLQTALALKNSDNAQALALALSQQRGDSSESATAAELLIAAQFDTGFYESIRLVAPEGRVLVERRAAQVPSEAPGWFVRLAPIESPPGIAQVSQGWQPLGQLEVVSTARFAHADLWQGSLRSALWLAGVGVLLGVAGALVLGRIRKPLQTTVAQAEALIERRFVTMPEPAVPELKRLSAAMNALVRRLQSIFGEQDRQLDALRHAAQVDAITGLAQRDHFFAELDALLASPAPAAGGSLMLLRLPELAAMNRRHGHHAVDRWLAAWAERLRAQLGGRPGMPVGVRIGRLNGSDFAVVTGASATQPLAALAAELHAAMSVPVGDLPPAPLALGAIAWSAGATAADLMREADAALAQAEVRPDGDRALFVDVPRSDALHEAAAGESVWRERIATALAQGDARLGTFPVVARDGSLLHLEAPLRLRLQGEELPAARWLAWAIRTGLVAEADLTAVRLGLRAIGQDGQPRAINLAPESLADGDFMAALHELLGGQPKAARALSLEVGERVAVDRLPLVRELSRLAHPLGVRVGLEHAGERLGRIDRLYEAHLDYVKLDRRLVTGLAAEPRRAEFVRGLVWMLHGLGTTVHAEGVAEEADAEALWQCGVNGQTGPWVTAGAGRRNP